MVRKNEMRTLKDLVNGFKNLNKIAVIDRKEYRRFSYTYQELYVLSQKFAIFLRENNLKKGDKIIVWAYNGIEYALIFLGAFLEGVIIVPIDLRSNLDFVDGIQKQVDAKIIFQTRYKPRLKKKKVIFTEQILDILDNVKIKKGSVKINEDDITEIIYTSGTTGAPKGVILTNRNFISNINALNEIEKVDSEFKFLSVLPLSHVFEQTVGFFLPLSNKSTIVYIKSLKASALFEAFSEEKITNMVIVPRLLEIIYSGIFKKVKDENKEKQFNFMLRIAKKLPFALRKILFSKIHKKLGNNINYFICGGATLNKELEQFYNAIGILILQGYGLTETSPVLTANSLKDRKIGSVGKVLPSIEIRIDENKEILAKGDTISQGYYKNPKKTRDLFKKGWLKTGDIGYIDSEGFLYLKGRKKDMIVTSAGMNIYPEDLENVINKIEGIKDSCIIGVETKKGEEIYAVLLLKRKANAKKIISKANKNLDAAQKIKNYSVWPYEDFPRTTTLKIKKFLVKEFVQKKAKPIRFVKKKNKVYAILSQLSPKKITRNSSLHDLGLSSIDRVELVSLLEQEFNLEIDEEKILPNTKVKELENIVKMQKLVEKEPIFKKWALSNFIRVLRLITQKLFLFPFARLFSWPAIEGKENLKGIKGPVIFASNHQSYFDTPVILMKLPLRFSQKTAVAAWQEYFFKPDLKFKNFTNKILFYLLTLFFNIYPLPQEKGFRKSMEYTGDLIDKGWNILVYPEGHMTSTGEIVKFKQGVGMLAVEMKVPIVPLKIENLIKILPKWKKWPSFGRAKIKIGKPIEIKQDSYIKTADRIEKTVRGL